MPVPLVNGCRTYITPSRLEGRRGYRLRWKDAAGGKRSTWFTTRLDASAMRDHMVAGEQASGR